SAGASSAYLTASEVFPMEIRANAIAYIYALGTLVGGALAPYIFGLLIQTHAPRNVFFGYLVGSFLMVLGGLTELLSGVDSERKSLEQVAVPLTALEVGRGDGPAGTAGRGSSSDGGNAKGWSVTVRVWPLRRGGGRAGTVR